MSGICGFVGLNGLSPGSRDMDTLLDPLKRRGPDGSRTWIGSGVTLGHALLATTPEALVERLPLHHGESRSTITADVRLDNRDDLIRALGLTGFAGDGELILHSYLKWGDDCPNHLLGDFAFAIWDDRQQRLFCARDQMGMRQLAYCHLPARAFVFATEPRAVVQHPLVPKALNEGRIADFLDDLERGTLTETFYTAVSRLPPAHTLIVDGSGMRLQRYWTLRMPAELRLKSDDEYVEAFLDVFETAVECRLRSANGVGTMLSGGLDSGSVSAVAAGILARNGRGPIQTFSVAGADPTTSEETRAILDSSRMSGIAPNIIRVTEMDPYLEEIIRLTKEQDEPFDTHMGLIRTIYLSAHRNGLKVVLDGVAGDIVLSATSYVAKLLRSGQLRTAWQESWAHGRYWDSSWVGFDRLLRSAWAAWMPPSLVAARRRAVWSIVDQRIGRSSQISKHFSDATDLRARRRRLRLSDAAVGPLDADQRAWGIAHAMLTVGRERYDRVASAMAIEPRDPFMDLRLIDFSLSLPWHQLESKGRPKILLRRAMAGKLSDFVRWRTGREHIAPQHLTQLVGALMAEEMPMGRVRETLQPFVRPAALLRLPKAGGEQHCKEWLDTICLYYWLNSVSEEG